MTDIIVLINGYFKNISKTRCRGGATITLIRDNKVNILVDTGNIVDKGKIIKGLKKAGLGPKDINIVVNTHSHQDHTGCNYLFPQARFLVHGAAFWDDIFDRSIKSQKITKNIKLISTPGHSEDSCSVLVKSKLGTVAIVGDLFWKENDYKIKLLEKDCSNLKLFYKNRKAILTIADWIIPGHGKMFKVKKHEI